ncbi:MAG: AAA family ATPase [Phycisphaerae bacterium]|nr:AAA family ATPase [Phycisphaerae bacterium]
MDMPLIKSVHFKNYKALRDTTLPLERLTILIGPNGSGKSTALEGIQLRDPSPEDLTVAARHTRDFTISVTAEDEAGTLIGRGIQWHSDGRMAPQRPGFEGQTTPQQKRLRERVEGYRIFALDASPIAAAVQLKPSVTLGPKGENLAGVLDRLRDEHPERWEALNEELGSWIPEFDRVLFATPGTGDRAIQLRTRKEQKPIPAADISQGTLLALAILTLAYLPDPPPIIGLEEPGRGIHPRLLRDVRDAIYRLVYPERFGESRQPVQVICTTHSPYFLDLFRDEPEAIVIANKTEDNVQFTRLMDLPNIEEVLGQTPPLGELWYSGVLGGVPADK